MVKNNLTGQNFFNSYKNSKIVLNDLKELNNMSMSINHPIKIE